MPLPSKNIIPLVKEMSGADIISAYITTDESLYSRFARGRITARAKHEAATAHIRLERDRKKVTFSAPLHDTEKFKAFTRRAAELLELIAEDPEYVPLPSPAGRTHAHAIDEATSGASVRDHEERLLPVIEKHGETLAGFFEHGTRRAEFVSSAGHQDSFEESFSLFSCTARVEGGSGKARQRSHSLQSMNLEAIAESASRTAHESRNPKSLPPGDYPVILSAGAMADFLAFFIHEMDRRKADEGRSYFSRPDGGTLIDSHVAAPNVNIWSDPGYAALPSAPFTHDGYPIGVCHWVTNGRLNSLPVSPYWAKNQSLSFVPPPSNIIMSGGTASLETLIKKIERGLFVHHVWYLRSVDPKQILITGMTRDGVFLIEDGQIKHPVNNFRFNESPAQILQHVVDTTPTEVAWGAEVDDKKIAAPTALIGKFRFSSVSEAQ